MGPPGGCATGPLYPVPRRCPLPSARFDGIAVFSAC